MSICVASCGGSGGGSAAASASLDPARVIVSRVELENGAGTVVLAADGRAWLATARQDASSIDGLTLVHEGAPAIQELVSTSAGVVTLLADGTATLSPDGLNLAGGGQTQVVSTAQAPVRDIADPGDGVQALLADGRVVWSPDGHNLGGGGQTVALPAWSTVTAGASFGPRDSGRSTRFLGTTWFGGGFFHSAPDTSYLDLWRSGDDGATWSLAFGSATPSTDLPADFYDPYSPLLVYRGSLWAVGSTVWSSADGLQWSRRTVSGPARAREDVAAFVVGDGMAYVDPQAAMVHLSPDGLDWSESVQLDGFAPRCGAVIRQFPDGHLVIAGGGDCAYGGFFDDVWESSDGREWHQVQDSKGAPVAVPWRGRMWPCTTVSPSGVLWMIGGYRIDGGVGVNLADVWYSRDGVHWQESVVRTGSRSPRHAASCLHDEDNASLRMFAGKGGASGLNDNASVLNDVAVLRVPVDDFLP